MDAAESQQTQQRRIEIREVIRQYVQSESLDGKLLEMNVSDHVWPPWIHQEMWHKIVNEAKTVYSMLKIDPKEVLSSRLSSSSSKPSSTPPDAKDLDREQMAAFDDFFTTTNLPA